MGETIAKLSVLGRTILVKRVTQKHMGAVTKDKADCGFFDGETIYLNRTLSEERLRRVLLHEVTHAILSVSGVTNMLPNKHEEAICDAMESLVDLFRDPLLNKFLSK